MHKLSFVDPRFVDRAWRDGASCLAEACKTSGGEITGDQLKLMLSRGERTLVALQDEEDFIGWGVYHINQYPNLRVLHIADLVCHNGQFQRFWDELKTVADANGCSEIRWSCNESRRRLYAMALKDEVIEQVYSTYRVKL